MVQAFTTRLLPLFILGLIIRLALAPITYHSDLLLFDFTREVLSSGHVLDFYDYLPSLSADDPILKVYPVDQFNYPPAVYFLLGGSAFLFTSLMEQTFHQQFIFNIAQALYNPLIFLHIFLLKLPFFFFDFGTAFLLMKLFTERKQKILAFGLWMINPVTLYATFMVGQFDIIPVFFTVLSLVFIQKYKVGKEKYLYYAAVILGVGAAFKIWPVLLLPALIVSAQKWKDRIFIGITTMAIYVLPLIPFFGSEGFRRYALVANQTQKSMFAQIPISGGESLILFVIGLLFFYLLFLYNKGTIQNLWQRYFIILLIFFIFTHFHPQWFLWITPFLILELILAKGKHMVSLLLMLFSLNCMILLYEPGLNINLFAPLNPSLYDGPSLWQNLGITFDLNYMRSLVQSVFVANALYFIYCYFPAREVKE